MKWLFSMCNWKLNTFLMVVLILFTVYIFPHYQHKINILANEPLTSLDASFKYDLETVLTLFNKMGSEGREIYNTVLTFIDSVYPLVYGALFLSLLASLFKKITDINSKLRLLVFMPLSCIVFDYLENYNIRKLLNLYPDIPLHQVNIASLMTQLKWISILIVLMSIAILIGLLVIKKIKELLKNKPNAKI